MINLQIDRLINPSHHFGGLSPGNKASENHKYKLSFPKKAAKQGLQKVKILLENSVPQILLPPAKLPHLNLIKKIGYRGNIQKILSTLKTENPHLLQTIWSSSSMWMANAATVSPFYNTKNHKTHITFANLNTMFHRSLETTIHKEHLHQVFSEVSNVQLHSALPNHSLYSDEGEANHISLFDSMSNKGLEIFIYSHDNPLKNNDIISRQNKQASLSLVRVNQSKNHIIWPQNKQAIKSGVFHNDVIAFGSGPIFIHHEQAYTHLKQFQKKLQQNLDSFWKGPFFYHVVTNKELSLDDAISTYFFNGQLARIKGNEYIWLLPIECKKNYNCMQLIKKIKKEISLIKKVVFVRLKESMSNGGGPACLRIQVELPESSLKKINRRFLLTPTKVQKIENLINNYYPDSINLEKLAQAELINQSHIVYSKACQTLNFQP